MNNFKKDKNIFKTLYETFPSLDRRQLPNCLFLTRLYVSYFIYVS